MQDKAWLETSTARREASAHYVSRAVVATLARAISRRPLRCARGALENQKQHGGGRPWPARSCIRLISARKRGAHCSDWTIVFCCSNIGRRAFFRGPGASRPNPSHERPFFGPKSDGCHCSWRGPDTGGRTVFIGVRGVREEGCEEDERRL